MRSAFLSFLFILLTVFLCAQPFTTNKNDLYPYEGTYALGNDHRITLGIFDEFNKSLVYLDLKTLKQGVLIPVKKNVFKDNNDSCKLFIFLQDNKKIITGLKITDNTSSVVAKKIFPHIRQSVSFVSDNRILKGDLYVPAAKGPHPAVVFAHGSGASTRSVAFFTTYFLQLGMAVLTFDK